MALGQKVPDFAIPGTGGRSLSSAVLAGRKTVLYFYPKDQTPGCTLEGQEFQKLQAEFKKANAQVFGISQDSLKSHEKFKEKMGFSFDLLSDGEGQLCRLFDVIKEKNMYGRKFMGIERSTFVLDENSVLVGAFRKVKAPGHALEILNFVKALKAAS